MSGIVVVGVDGSDGARRALAWAAKEARLHRARLRVVLAWSYLHQPGGAEFDPSYGEDDARRTLDEAIVGLGDDAQGIDIEPVAVCDLPVHALLEAAGPDADLLVVGARGLGGFQGLLLGAVSQQVIQHAPCPVAVVRHQGARRQSN